MMGVKFFMSEWKFINKHGKEPRIIYIVMDQSWERQNELSVLFSAYCKYRWLHIEILIVLYIFMG